MTWFKYRKVLVNASDIKRVLVGQHNELGHDVVYAFIGDHTSREVFAAPDAADVSKENGSAWANAMFDEIATALDKGDGVIDLDKMGAAQAKKLASGAVSPTEDDSPETPNIPDVDGASPLVVPEVDGHGHTHGHKKAGS